MRDRLQNLASAASDSQLPNYAFGAGVLMGGTGIWLVDVLGFDGTASFLMAVGLVSVGAMTVNQYGIGKSLQAAQNLGISLYGTANSYLRPQSAAKETEAPVARKTM